MILFPYKRNIYISFIFCFSDATRRKLAQFIGGFIMRKNGKGLNNVCDLTEMIQLLNNRSKSTISITVSQNQVGEYFKMHKEAHEEGYNHIFSNIEGNIIWNESNQKILAEEIHKTADYYLECLVNGKEFSVYPFEEMFSKIECVNDGRHQKKKENIDVTMFAFYEKCLIKEAKRIYNILNDINILADRAKNKGILKEH